MKLKDFLKKLEGLDPEIELYRLFSRNLHSDTVVKLEDVDLFPYISYVEELKNVTSANKEDQLKNIPILIISN